MTVLIGPAVSTVGAHPPAEPDHGLNETTFLTLWSGDEDAVDVGDSKDASALALLANATDVPLDSPPQAVGQWNRGDHRDFPTTGPDRSVAPPDARLEDGRFIADAHATIFAVEPSTRVFVSPTEQPLYVAPAGSVLGTVDYRVDIPDSSSRGSRHVSWRLVSTQIVETRLLIDGDVAAREPGTARPELRFTDIEALPGETHTLTIEADLRVELTRTVDTRRRVCPTENSTNSTCRSVRDSSTLTSVETITVSDSVDVVVHDLSIVGFWARYPDGDLGLVVYTNGPWLGFSLPEGDVRGVWRFYSARDPNWDTLVTHRENGSTSAHSPLHSLQVYAYPFEPGPTAVPRASVEILDAYGRETEPPTLPEDVHLDVLREPYEASYGLATRVHRTNASYENLTAVGLVRGVTLDSESAPFVEHQINRSELELTVEDRTAETVTVTVRLRDAATGAPISTAQSVGYVEFDGEIVDTGEDGTVRRTLPLESGAITARYEPAPWWYHPRSYVGSSDAVYVGRSVADPLSTAYHLGVPIGLFLLGVFLVDRITGWRIWPPWRGV